MAAAQNGIVKGQIIDEEGIPLEYANILILNSADSTLYKGGLSEKEGWYTIDRIDDGSYLIHSTMIGFGNAYSKSFSIINSNTVQVSTLKLTNGIEIDEVTVTAKKPFIELKADKMIINVANSSISAGNSALEVLEKSPGVIVDNNNNISLRGKQGVLVTINGKNQYMSGDEITRLLETMPASNIDNIEIITNPSAKYDAEGNSGIINIVLKKNENIGSNGSVSTQIRQGWRTSHNHNLNLNYRSEKVNIYGAGEYYNWGWEQNLRLMRNIPFENGVTAFNQLANMVETGDGYNLSLGMDWNVSDNTSISLLAKRNEGDEEGLNDNTTNISGDNSPEFNILKVNTIGNEDYNRQNYNANVNHKFNDNGLDLSFDIDYNMYDNTELVNYDNFFLDADNVEVDAPFYLRNNRNTAIDILASKLDLTLPISEKVNLEIGTKISMVNTDNGTQFDQKDSQGTWIDQIDRSNDFTYSEDVMAAYLNGSGAIGSFMIQAGVRIEQTTSEGRSITLDRTVPRSYTDFFPSLSVSKSINEKHNLSATFSRRIERPNYKDLNPFENYLDQYTFEKGNPFLNPQYTNAYGVNYAMGRQLFVALNYSHTSDAITEVIEQVSEENKNYQTTQNLDDFSNISITVSAPKVWTEWWVSRLNYTGFYTDFKSEIPSGTLDNQKFTNMVNLNNELKIPGGWNLEVAGRYQGKLTFGLFEIDPQGSLDIGLSKSIINGRGNIKVNMSDIFRTKNSNVRIDQDDLDLLIMQTNDTRRITVNVSYRFGNDKVKAAKKRTTSAEEENGRI
ncbi:MAG: iron complex outermembrane receptor protein [Saprospiraceae bacterium]|jgi:iron complex outermembrane receptor protein